MVSINRNLNFIRLQGTAEQLEEIHLLFLELMNEVGEEGNSGMSPPQITNDTWLDWFNKNIVKLDDHQIKLFDDFLEALVKEITSSRERDITLI